ncbi:MAG: long-chain fatty acid--CoA ligase [Muribaculaceae bacterium]|nr:long-chain fatty acid--CoA ligase [Muribaculaceae bacterium]
MHNILTDLTTRQSLHYGSREAISFRDRGTKQWVSMSWDSFHKQVIDFACALEIMGVEPQSMVNVFSANCAEILITDFACFRNRAIPVSLYATSSREQVEFIINDSGATMIMVGDQSQYNIVREVAANCPTLKTIVTFDDTIALDKDDKMTMRFSSMLKLGEAAGDASRETVNRRCASAVPEDIATLIYTSGTTGEPKGAILPHSCFDAAIAIHHKRLDTLSDKDRSLCFLPLSHIFEKAWTYYCLDFGIKVAINDNPKEIQTVIREIKPTCMCSVPRFWEKVYTAVQEKIAAMTGLKKIMVERALKIGSIRNLKYARVGRRAPWMIEAQYRFFDKRILSVMRKAIGINEGNIFPTAGAPLSANIVEFFHACGVNIVIGYGLSETTATVTCFPTVNYEIGTVGTPLPEIEVKIGADNEILVKAPTVMRGYYRRPEATAEAFTEDGWFRTGDAGRFDEKGALILTERIKDLFKTSNGKYIAPQAIESRLGEDKYIEQVAVIGDQRKYVTAIIIPAFEALKEYARRKKIAFRSIDELIQNNDIKKMIAERIERLQKGFANFEKIKRFTLLPKEFSIESGELTNTLKLRRPIINNRYAHEIEAMYC